MFSCSKPQLKSININNFDPIKFKKENLYIAPIINTSDIKLLNTSELYIEKLLKKYIKKFGFINSNEFTKILETKNLSSEYNKIQKLYVSGKLKNEDLGKLLPNLNSGYLVLTNISYFHINEYEDEQDVMVFDNKGEADWATEVSRHIVSTIRGTFTLIDITSKEKVFDVEHEISKQNISTHTERNCIDSIIAGLLGDLFKPKPIGPNKMVKIFFKQIIQNIPEK